MSKATTGIVAAVGIVAIVSLVLNILIWVKVKDDYSDTKTNSEPNVKYEQIPIKINPIPTAVRHTAPKSRPTKTRLRTITSVGKGRPFGSNPEPMYVNDTHFCPSYGEPDNKPEYQEAASFILSGLDQHVDPCDDFYTFACNTYIKTHNASEIGVERIGTYDEAQDAVNLEITDALLPVEVSDTSRSETERIVKAVSRNF
ncbi:unnamed protein product [Cylicostephanus goldi]|uniref:Peptidase M13 N-terminal domain-containing protein n=1 Tax=Cylicostephanus goldi TaxID=71465 RepID=A0A3P6S8U0_CYLGO|nr:unnamed protein product [Cylicostephanus goldi]